jgi:glycosyltransferase involved in cell wall biosynthesis
MADKYNILYFHQDALITGSLISLKNIVSTLDKQKFNPIVILPQKGPAQTRLEQDGIQVIIHPFNTFWTTPKPRCFSRDNLRQLIALIPNFKLRKLIKHLNPHLIHLNDKATINVGLSSIKLGIPVVQHSRSAFHITACKPNKMLCSSIIRNYADHIICISEDEEQGFEPAKNKSILFNSVDQNLALDAISKREQTRASLGISNTEFVIGVAENLGVYKGLFEVIKLADTLLQKYPIVLKFMLVGNISDQDDLSRFGIPLTSKQYVEEFIQKNQYQQKVIVTGFRTDALNLIAAMDTVLIAKAHGVLGRQPLEAQSVGVPVVAINGHSKRSTIVQNGVTGFLVSKYDELAEKIELLINNNDMKLEMSKQGIAYAKTHFNPAKNGIKLEEIYYRLIQRIEPTRSANKN